ncbi:MAG: hypothetical protein DMG58_31745 [Acidobacteria bacterium]|nr:MAG: hypothetical protein DMG58_31745 [Acidobacteriota bacterium]
MAESTAWPLCRNDSLSAQFAGSGLNSLAAIAFACEKPLLVERMIGAAKTISPWGYELDSATEQVA